MNNNTSTTTNSDASTPSPASLSSPSCPSSPADPNLQKKANALIEKVEFNLKWVTTYLNERRDVKAGQSQWKKLEDEANKLFVEQFLVFPEVLSLQAKVELERASLSAKVQAAERENEIDKIISEAKVHKRHII